MPAWWRWLQAAFTVPKIDVVAGGPATHAAVVHHPRNSEQLVRVGVLLFTTRTLVLLCVVLVVSACENRCWV